MKTLLLVSFFTLCSSLAYAGSGCNGDGCDTDKKGEKTGLTDSSIIVAGSSCGDGCGDKKGKKDKTAPKTGLFEYDSQLAGSSCGDGCGDKKGKKDKTDATKKSGFTASTELTA